ncbi:MAG: pyridoxal 5'-phosphate synthase [Saprospiraceae bacterium]|nr:pyridoxal 5'-phosphate synthase [Saprospiraceae bacterium]
MNVFEKFADWHEQELKTTKAKLPNACSFTSIGLDGYPNTRFVSLKEVKEESFIITGPINSRKGKEVLSNPKVSIAFWWSETERQVRIQGDASFISDSEADEYFENRNRASKIVSSLFNQGETIESFERLNSIFVAKEKNFKNKISRPKEWGGFSIQPIRIEFMQFKNTRLHQRVLFERVGSNWELKYIQP